MRTQYRVEKQLGQWAAQFRVIYDENEVPPSAANQEWNTFKRSKRKSVAQNAMNLAAGFHDIVAACQEYNHRKHDQQ